MPTARDGSNATCCAQRMTDRNLLLGETTMNKHQPSARVVAHFVSALTSTGIAGIVCVAIFADPSVGSAHRSPSKHDYRPADRINLKGNQHEKRAQACAGDHEGAEALQLFAVVPALPLPVIDSWRESLKPVAYGQFVRRQWPHG